MDIIMVLVFSHMVIGAVLCFAQWIAIATGIKGGRRVWPARLIPAVAMICWIVIPAYGFRNNPGGVWLLFLAVGAPMLLLGGLGLVLGYRLGKRGR